jgi:hypothetical protein
MQANENFYGMFPLEAEIVYFQSLDLETLVNLYSVNRYYRALLEEDYILKVLTEDWNINLARISSFYHLVVERLALFSPEEIYNMYINSKTIHPYINDFKITAKYALLEKRAPSSEDLEDYSRMINLVREDYGNSFDWISSYSDRYVKKIKFVIKLNGELHFSLPPFRFRTHSWTIVCEAYREHLLYYVMTRLDLMDPCMFFHDKFSITKDTLCELIKSELLRRYPELVYNQEYLFPKTTVEEAEESKRIDDAIMQDLLEYASCKRSKNQN